MKLFVRLATMLAPLPVLLACNSSASTSDDAGHPADGATGSADSPSNDAPTDGNLDAGLPPLDPNAAVASLTSAQLGELCDWWIAQLGGYDASYSCGGPETIVNPSNQAQCIADISYNSACTLTVQEFENCISAELPSHACDRPGNDCMIQSNCLLRDM
jgi:hypothetical protein